MKNRRLLIVSFLLVSVLLVGIGFAQVTGNLMVKGTATFTGKTLTQSNVMDALEFVRYNAKNCEVEIGSGSTGAGQNATMTVAFHDYEGNTSNTFTASAVLTIQYGTAGDNLPDITLGDISEQSVLPSADKGVFVVTPEWVSGGDVTGTGLNEITLTAGQTTCLKVTVTYTKVSDASMDNSSCDATISVKIPYATVIATE